jgi:hypothetical protein
LLFSLCILAHVFIYPFLYLLCMFSFLSLLILSIVLSTYLLYAPFLWPPCVFLHVFCVFLFYHSMSLMIRNFSYNITLTTCTPHSTIPWHLSFYSFTYHHQLPVYSHYIDFFWILSLPLCNAGSLCNNSTTIKGDC